MTLRRKGQKAQRRGTLLPRGPSVEETLAAAVSGPVVEVEDIRRVTKMDPYDGDSAVIESDNVVTHRRSRRITMYDSQGRSSSIPVESMGVVMKAGLRGVCPLCNSTHETDDFNACPAREPLKFIRCPVCAQNGKTRLIPDDPLGAAAIPDTKDDPNEISLPAMENQTPEQRIQARLFTHMATFHPQESLSYQVPPAFFPRPVLGGVS